MAERILLDTDIGTDIDDAYALSLCLRSPELELVGVTTAHGDTALRARLALRLLHECGRDDIPVAVGRPTGAPEGHVNQGPWAAEFTTVTPVDTPAAEFIVEQVNAAPGELTLVPIGPLTNIADALALDPDLPGKVKRIVIMGGCVGLTDGPCAEIRPEYNIVTDIPAAQALFACGIPFLMVPLDATLLVHLEQEHRARLAAHTGQPAAAMTELLSLWPSRRHSPVLHDPLAVAMLFEPSLCTVSRMQLAVDDAGLTRPHEPGAPVDVALWPDARRFVSLFVERLLR